MNKAEILHSLLTITYSKEMEYKLRETIGHTISIRTLRDAIETDICDSSIIKVIERIAPICYSIGDKIFLKGETKGSFDFIGDDMDYQSAIELYDMTTEMACGDSYSFYVSSVTYFPFATCGDIIKVKDFLNSLP